MMNGKELRGGNNGNLRAPRKVSNCFKDREEELSFFRDLKKHEKDQIASLLQPVSEEFEANGNHGELYRMDSGGRKGPGFGFLAENGKNDYNWLKTPPATPLFPSLEMESGNGQELVVQREIPINQPLSRFAGHQEVARTSNKIISTSPNSKPKLPQRHRTPTASRPIIPSSVDKKNMKTAPVLPTHKMNQSNIGPVQKQKPALSPVTISITHKDTHHTNFLASNLSKTAEMDQNNPTAKPKITRGVSPLSRPTIPGFSDQTPSNLRTTNRPASATRGRPSNQNVSIPQKQDMDSKIRRQSCSPSVNRGRKQERGTTDIAQGTIIGAKVQLQAGNRAGQVVGSRMLDRFMNARISSAEDRMQGKMKLNNSMNESLRSSGSVEERQLAAKIKLNGSLNESSGFGIGRRFMSKNSLDMEFQRESRDNRKHGIASAGRHS